MEFFIIATMALGFWVAILKHELNEAYERLDRLEGEAAFYRRNALERRMKKAE